MFFRDVIRRRSSFTKWVFKLRLKALSTSKRSQRKDDSVSLSCQGIFFLFLRYILVRPRIRVHFAGINFFPLTKIQLSRSNVKDKVVNNILPLVL